MSESANSMIPAEIREQFPQDEQGRVLFFTTPPVGTQHVIQGRTSAEKGDQLAHSLRYLAVKADRERERDNAARKRQLDGPAEVEMENNRAPGSNKKVKAGLLAAEGEERDADGRIRADAGKAREMAAATQDQQLECLKTRALATLVHQLDQGTDSFYKTHYGDKAEEYRAIDARKQRQLAERRQAVKGPPTISVPADTVVDWKRNPWRTGFKDDYDARY
jgi:chromatin structure-remodeling complex subunit RSC1/2